MNFSINKTGMVLRIFCLSLGLFGLFCFDIKATQFWIKNNTDHDIVWDNTLIPRWVDELAYFPCNVTVKPHTYAYHDAFLESVLGIHVNGQEQMFQGTSVYHRISGKYFKDYSPANGFLVEYNKDNICVYNVWGYNSLNKTKISTAELYKKLLAK